MVLAWENREDPSGFRVEVVNPAMVELTGRRAHEIVGRALADALPELSSSGLPRRLVAALLSGRSQRLDGLEWGPNRERVWSVQAVPLVDDRVGVIAEDVTALTQAQKERDRMEAQMRDSQRLEAIGRLAGGVAHDFNNILTAIDAYAILCRDQLDEGHPARDDIQTVLEASQRAASLTSQLLAFGRKQVQQLQAIDVNRIISEIDRILQRLIGEQVDLVTMLAPDLGAVKADQTQIEQVIMNLAINARCPRAAS
jgi:signal transduction histidine kinase